jgi:MoCo/4Fe-4S cofactor protein with predicted Tat translocation signal
MSNTKKYWKSVEYLNNDSHLQEQAQNEFAEKLPIDEFLGKSDLSQSSTSRRDFLKFLGFSVTAATLAACEAPVTKAIPYVIKPEEITPGVANFYASTYSDGNDFCNVLVKTREGRPIHIEGNKLSTITKGGVNARVNASVLSLYDSTRLKNPLIAGEKASWDTLDKEIASKLTEIASKGGNIRIVSNSISSPSTKLVVDNFITAFKAGESDNVKHISFDNISYSGMLSANQENFGNAIIPSYDFSKANTIVAIGADFLANWLSPIEFAAQYAQTRNPEKNMSKHYQFEACMSLTGSNADVRCAVKPSELGKVAVLLYNEIAKSLGGGTLPTSEVSNDDNANTKIQQAAKDLLANKGKSLVVCGDNDTNVQSVVNSINYLLGNYGNTIQFTNSYLTKQAVDSEIIALINEIKSGKIDAIIFNDVNLVYALPSSLNVAEELGKVKLKIAITERLNETASVCDYVCANSNYLESWNDHNPKVGSYSLTQPVISNLFDTRQSQVNFLKWSNATANFEETIKNYWLTNLYTKQTEFLSFEGFWNNSLRNGVFNTNETLSVNVEEIKADLKANAEQINKISSSNLELVLYTSVSIGDGKNLRNPWLQELACPISKVVWDNFIAMNPTDMEKEGFNTNIQQQRPANLATVTANGQSITLPVVATPGQKVGTIGIALGYGQQGVEVEGEMIGKNAYGFVSVNNNNLKYYQTDVTMSSNGETYPVACTQTHHTMMGRKIVNETNIDTFKNQDRKIWNPLVEIPNAYGKKMLATELSLWNEHDIDKGHRWGMAIDLNTCIGCGACVTACNSENNVPVVGKDEVRRNREMHWLRIDRYFSSDADPARHSMDKGDRDYHAMEVPKEYPQVVHQPVMCQHCNHAPCETVCPVAATTHSNEGFNQMAYNRCVGTRYCANNCPYKVRRFNWFNYYRDEKFTNFNPSQDDLARMVLNPDVVVRSRGVMEKCSMCVQRVQEGKLNAKKQGKSVEDGAIQTACSSSCPTQAITFGDYNNSSTKVNQLASTERAYHLLEEVGTKPNIWYLTKVRNTEENKTENA